MKEQCRLNEEKHSISQETVDKSIKLPTGYINSMNCLKTKIHKSELRVEQIDKVLDNPRISGNLCFLHIIVVT